MQSTPPIPRVVQRSAAFFRPCLGMATKKAPARKGKGLICKAVELS